MLFKRLASAALAAVVGMGAVNNAMAEDLVITPNQVQALIQRLDAAESRINELETEKAAAAQRQAQAPGFLSGDTQAANNMLSRVQNLENRWLQLEQSRTSLTGMIDPEDDDFPENANYAALREQVDGIQKMLDDGFVSDGTSRNTMAITGRIHGDAWGFPSIDPGVNQLDRDMNPQDRLIFRRVRFGVKGKIQDHMHYKIEMEFADPNDTQIRDLYVGWDNLPFLQTLRVGNQKRPIGLDHINSSRYNVFIERPFIIEAFNQDARRLGLVSYGVTPDQSWNWRYGFYNMELTQGDEGYTGDHWQGQFAARLANTAWWDDCTDGRSYIHWAVSGSFGWPDGNGGPGGNLARFDTRPEARTRDDWLDTGAIPNADAMQQLGFETAMNFGPLQIVGEVEQSWVERKGGSSDVHFWGGYVYASYFLTGEHMPWDRKTGQLGRQKPFQNFWIVDRCDDGVEAGWGAWQVAARYSYADLNDQEITGGEAEALTLGLNWYWNANAHMQFNYINGEIANATNRNTTVPQTGDYHIVGARFLVDF